MMIFFLNCFSRIFLDSILHQIYIRESMRVMMSASRRSLHEKPSIHRIGSTCMRSESGIISHEYSEKNLELKVREDDYWYTHGARNLRI
jgi:hypothetical protein